MLGAAARRSVKWLAMKPQLTGKVALVTGGARRIGRAIVQALLREGCAVVVHYRSSAKEAAEVVLEARAAGQAAWRVQGDLRDEQACRDVVRKARRLAGRLDILVNNSAVFTKEPLSRVTGRSLRAEFEQNLFAPILLTRHFAAVAKKGQVVNILDRRIEGNDPSCIPYLLSKKALAAFTRAAALALAPRISVNAVAPGPILPPPGKGHRYLTDHAGRMPLGRRLVPADVADAVVALLKCRATTGQTLFVDGGQHLLGEGV